MLIVVLKPAKESEKERINRWSKKSEENHGRGVKRTPLLWELALNRVKEAAFASSKGRYFHF